MRATSIALFAISLCLLAACQPSPEERFEKAQNFFGDHEYRAATIELKNLLRERPDNAGARLLLAKSAYQLADFGTAQSEAERALSLGLIEADAWYVLGRSLLAQGDRAGALERVVPNLRAETARGTELVLIGDILLSLGNRGEAAEHYLRALSLNAGEIGALVGQAVIARESGDKERAEEFLRKARDLNPESDSAWRAWGNYLRAERQFVASADAYDRAIRFETPSTPLAERLVARINLVTSLLDANETERGSEQFGQLEQRFPNHPATRFLRGRLAYALGDYSTAEAELRAYLADIPNDLRGVALLGAVNFSQNHLRQAEEFLQRAARNNVGGGEVAKLLAETRLRLAQPDRALDGLRGLDIESNKDPALMLLLGRAELGLGDRPAAIEYFSRGEELSELDDASKLSVAAAFLSAGEHERSIQILDQLPAYTGDTFEREALLMTSHIQAGDPAAAQAVGDQLLEAFPEDADAFVSVGAMRLATLDMRGAREAMEQALVLEPENVRANFLMAGLARAEGNAAATESYTVRTLELDPANVPALLLLARLYEERQELAQIEGFVEAGIAHDESNTVLYLLKARLASARKAPQTALDTIRAAREFVPEDPRLDHAEGLAQAQLGQPEIALSHLQQAVNGDPDNPRFLIDFATLLLANGNLSGAADVVTAYRNIAPDNRRGLITQVAILSRQAAFDQARDAILGFDADQIDSSELQSLLGDVEMAAKNYKEAFAAFERASEQDWNRDIAMRLARAAQLSGSGSATAPLMRWLENHPDDIGVRSLYARLLETMGDREAAKREYERLVDAGAEDPVALNNLAWKYAEEGRSEAIDLAQRAYQLAPKNGSVADTYGWILYQHGDVEQALAVLEKAAELSPENYEIQYHLATVLADSGMRRRANEIITTILASSRQFPSRAEAEALAKNL